MNARPPDPGLYLLATPIGSARDITLRALDLLATADILVAEDTRTLRKLMAIHDIPVGGRPMIAHHDHSGAAGFGRISEALEEGKVVVYASDAGTPMVADPGYRLVALAQEAGIKVHAAPGPSALTTALCLAGLPTDRFFFTGFLPTKPTARRKVLEELRDIKATLAFFESPKRVTAALADMAMVLGETREAAVCRELTKKFEEVGKGQIGEILGDYANLREHLGEFVILVGPPTDDVVQDEDIDAALRPLLPNHRVKEAATIVSDTLGVPRKAAYARALILKDGER